MLLLTMNNMCLYVNFVNIYVCVMYIDMNYCELAYCISHAPGHPRIVCVSALHELNRRVVQNNKILSESCPKNCVGKLSNNSRRRGP